MANPLSKIVAGTKAGAGEVAGNVMESIYSSGLFGTVLKSVVSQFQAKEDKDDQKPAKSFHSVEGTLVSVEKYLVQISDNVYNIAAQLGAQVTSMHEIEQMLLGRDEDAQRAAEEDATEDATSVVATLPPKQEAASEEGSTIGAIAKMFKGKDFKTILADIAAGLGKAILSFGTRLLALLNPIGIAGTIVAAIGYGVFQYFTNDEFKKSLDQGVSSLWNLAKDSVDPILEFTKKLVGGAFELVGVIWDKIKNWAAGAWDGVKSGAKAVASWFGFGDKNEKPAPTPVAKPTPTAEPAPAPAATPVAAVAAQPSQPPSAPAAKTAAPTIAAASVETAYAESMGVKPMPLPTAAPTQSAGISPTPSGTSPAGNPNDLEKNVTKADSGIDLNGLVTAFKARISGLATDFMQMTGQKMVVTSGFRSPEKQQALYAKDPGHAAPPGRSPHEVGTAVDINTADANKADQLGLLAKYNLFRPLVNRSSNPEPWHVEPVERKALASIGDGAAVPGSSGSAINPSSGKPVAIPPNPTVGSNIAAASQMNEQLCDQRSKAPMNVVIDNSRRIVQNMNVGMFTPPSPCEPRTLAALGA